MKILIYIFFAAVLLSASVYAQGSWGGPPGSNGTFTTAVYCLPQFGVITPPGTPVNLGNYFSLPYLQSMIPISGKFLEWNLIGPRQEIGGGPLINYDVQDITTPNSYIDNGVTIIVYWNIYKDGGDDLNMSGFWHYPNLHLKPRTGGSAGCDDGIARFEIYAIFITIAANATPGLRQFTTTLTASVSI